MCVKTICIVKNAKDCTREELVISSEWTDSQLRMMIIKDSSVVVTGEMPYSQFDQQVKYFDKDVKDYIKWMQDILGGQTDGIDFSLDEDKLTWIKKSSPDSKKSCILGRIRVNEATKINAIQILRDSVIRNSKLQKTISSSNKTIEVLEKENSILREDFEAAIEVKSKMETTLYTRFALILNEKKARMRELHATIQKLSGVDQSFNASTDDSDCEVLQNEEDISPPKKRVCKRYSNDLLGDKKKSDMVESGKIELDRSSDIEDGVLPHQEGAPPSSSVVCNTSATASQNNANLDDDEDTPELLSQESECEMELKFDEGGNEVSPNVSGQQESEEMF
ncbi:hypothetical protein QAD02_005780 [Eretmocerus hayati]|uniref:Uncharacterized protein n=1 Tax=Eretmocerus hayati TaxID=131215 RepID=A0ACC2NUH3_9HYME|nr:hypothetical protein QAD02_005780 [Eretmocerus hayati]